MRYDWFAPRLRDVSADGQTLRPLKRFGGDIAQVDALAIHGHLARLKCVMVNGA